MNFQPAKPYFAVWMGGKDVSAVLSPYLLSANYEDKDEGEADSLEISVDNSDGRFCDKWFPKRGGVMSLSFGYEGGAVRKTADFEIDEITVEGPPSVVRIRALASGVNSGNQTDKPTPYDNTTLSAIVQKVAKRMKKKLVGNIEAIPIRRVTQIYESDTNFLRRLASEYGYSFSIKGSAGNKTDTVVFIKSKEIRAKAVIRTITLPELSRYSIVDKLLNIVPSATVSYFDPKTKKLKKYTATDDSRRTSKDVISDSIRAENETQAKAKAGAALERSNESAAKLEGSLMGDPSIIAGLSINLVGLGKVSGKYYINSTRHEISRSSGYSTSFSALRIYEN